MLKIIAGDLKGRIIPYMKGGTYRPSTNKLREALFSIIASGEFAGENLLDGANFLDLFAGTGAIAFEAISRGVAHATLVDISREHLNLAEDTAKKFGIGDKFSFFRCSALNLPRASLQHDLIFIDPPYKEINKSFLSKILSGLCVKGWVAVNAVVMLEMHKTSDIEDMLDEEMSAQWEVAKVKLYGNSKLCIMRLNSRKEND
jgi:16S rRNA (guanine966-N2)-methyltransferase